MGCIRYELFFPSNTEKKFFPYQNFDKENKYIEQLIFNEFDGFEKFNEYIVKNEEAKDMVGSYRNDFGISACEFRIYEKRI